MPNKIVDKDGTITISKEVIANIAGAATKECYGIVGMASQSFSEELFELIGSDSVSKGIRVTMKDNKIDIELYIVVSYGTKISAVAQNIMDNVRYKVEKLTGMDLDRVNVIVQGVKTID